MKIMGIECGEELQAEGISDTLIKFLKIPKSQENLAHSGTRSLQNTK
jgi:hypothetical protein